MRFLLTAALLAATGCFDFDPAADRFTCESDDDCSDGYVCAGHSIVERDPVAYCVEESKATAGLHIFIGEEIFRDCEAIKAGTSMSWRVFFGVSSEPGVAPALPSEPTATCSASVDNAPCCLGAPDVKGNGHLMCVAPRAGVVALGARFEYLRGGSSFATMGASAEIAAEGPPLAEITYSNISTSCGDAPVDCAACPP